MAGRSPLRLALRGAALMLAACAAVPAWAGNVYYVSQQGGNDAASGLSPASAWATIGKAVSVAAAGDSVLISDGNYVENPQTVRSGSPGSPIVFRATGQNVFISASDDLNDEAFVKTPGFTNIYQLTGWHQGNLRQTHFHDIVVDDTNPSYFVMTESDGPIPLASTGITTLTTVDAVEGSYLVIGDTLYVHPYDNVAPGTAATDLWSNRNVPAFTVKHSDIVLDGFKIWYASSGSGAVTFTPAAHDCELKNCSFASGDFIASGSRHRIVNLRSTHNNLRSPPGYDWVTGNSGSGATIYADTTTVVGGEIWHNWNNLSSQCKDLTVDGLVIHGAPNHDWLPKDSQGLTLRNVVEYNAQDGLYISSCEDVLVESSTFFSGMFVQGYPAGNPIGVGPIMVRNCIFGGGADYGSTSTGTPVDVENQITFQNDIFLKTGSTHLFRHIADLLLYDMDTYVQHSTNFPGEPHVTFASCQQISSNFGALLTGGAWTPNTDAWDIHITNRSSPAYGTGSSSAAPGVDFEGDVRPQGGAFDIGADEYNEALGLPFPPSALGAGPSATVDRGILLGWTASPSPDVAAYVVYRSTAAIADTSGLAVATVGNVTAYADTTPAYGTFHYVVAARDTSGLMSAASNEAVAAAPDHRAPAAPSSLVGVAGHGAVTLGWTRNLEPDLMRYRVYGDSVAHPTTRVDSTASGADTVATVGGLVNGVSYHFRITAVDSSGNESGFSNEVTLTPTASAPSTPLPASGLTATPSATLDRGIALAWNASPSAHVVAYRVYRGTAAIGDTTGLGVASVGTVTAYADTTPAYGTYHYAVAAVSDSGVASALSNQAIAQAPDHLAPAAPLGLGGSAHDGGVNLSWRRSPEADTRRYRVYAGEPGSAGTLADSTASAADTTIALEGLADGTSYDFRVSAVDSSGNESPRSNAVELTPVGPAPALSASIFQDPVVTGHLDVAVVSSRALGSAPVVRLALSPDTIGVPVVMNLIAGGGASYHGVIAIAAGGNYALRTHVRTFDGVDAEFDRAFSALPVLAGRPAALASTDGRARVEARAGAFGEGVLLVAETGAPGDAWSYRFWPETGAASGSLAVELPYDRAHQSDAGKLFVETADAGRWSAVPTAVHDQRGFARAAVSRLGAFRVAEHPEFGGDNRVPESFMVRPNFPNPFHPETTIAYQIPADAVVDIRVYDPAGRRVATLVHERVSAGYHAALWNGRDGAGEPVASGIYFCSVESGGARTVLKLTLLR